MTWRQVIAFIRQLPDNSALARAQDGDAAVWGLFGQLLALIGDQLAIANWQRSGGKGPAPRPLRRPGVDNGDAVHGGDTGMSNADVIAVLHGYRTGTYAQEDDTSE